MIVARRQIKNKRAPEQISTGAVAVVAGWEGRWKVEGERWVG